MRPALFVQLFASAKAPEIAHDAESFQLIRHTHTPETDSGWPVRQHGSFGDTIPGVVMITKLYILLSTCSCASVRAPLSTITPRSRIPCSTKSFFSHTWGPGRAGLPSSEILL